MQLCIFEDKRASAFLPLAYSRPVYDLILGYTPLKDKIFRLFQSLKHSVHCRSYLANVYKQNNPGVIVNSIEDNECLFINGRLIADNKLAKFFLKRKENIVYVLNDTIIAAFLSGSNLESFKNNFKDDIGPEDFDGLPVEKIEAQTINFIWDLINLNGKELTREFENLFNKKKKKSQKKILGEVYNGVHLVNKKEIIIEKGAVVKPGVVIDASNGPVYIGKDTEIFPNAVIEGPAYIGESAKIKSGAVIYENTSIGEICKIGGEVESAVIMPYSNKQHAGFLGHAYLGSWINLGADTNNSDLKNNYSTVKVYVNGGMIDSGSQFLGLTMGDHSKSAINTMFNTGTVVGFSCNIFGSGFPGKFVPSFTWGGTEDSKVYDVEKSISTAKTVMQRRNKIMSGEEENLFRYIFDISAKERDKHKTA